jgi:adenylyltransferase/sulfurtransferase
MSDMERYKRQITFDRFGEESQRKLLQSRVCIIGTGALGSVIANNLCRAGVGYLRLIDRDYVEKVNLQRQILFTEDDAENEIPKAEAAAAALRLANSEIEIVAVNTDVNSSNIEGHISDTDIVIDGTDNFETRFLINEACHKHGVKWIYGGVIASGGATMNILYGDAPCFRCFMREMPAPGSYPTCNTAGVISPITGVIGSYETAEAMKILTGADEVSHDYLAIDVWDNVADYISVTKNPDCPVCVHGEYELLGRPTGAYTTSLCGHDSWQIIPGIGVKADLPNLARTLAAVGNVKVTKFSLDFDGDGASFKVYPDGRAIIAGVKDEKKAKEIYAEYIGI